MSYDCFSVTLFSAFAAWADIEVLYVIMITFIYIYYAKAIVVKKNTC